MKPLDAKFRRRLSLSPAPESLETRQVLSAGAGNTIAILPAVITQADKPASVDFTIAPSSFSSPRGSLLLGIDTVAPSNSNAKPTVTAVSENSGAKVQHSSYARGKPLVVGGQPVTPAVVARIVTGRGRSKSPHV